MIYTFHVYQPDILLEIGCTASIVCPIHLHELYCTYLLCFFSFVKTLTFCIVYFLNLLNIMCMYFVVCLYVMYFVVCLYVMYFSF